MANGDTLYLYEYADSDTQRISAEDSLNLNDGTTYTLPITYDPLPAPHDPNTDLYSDVQEVLMLTTDAATAAAKYNAVVALERWARKCQLHEALGGGYSVWLKFQRSEASNAFWARVHSLRVASVAAANIINLEIRRDGLWQGERASLYLSNTWTARATGVTLYNHLDNISHVFDYNNGAAGSPYTAGSFSANFPAYLLGNAKNDAASAIDGAHDAAYFGDSAMPFYGMSALGSAAASYTATMAWEYYNSSSGLWTAFTPLVDRTSKLTLPFVYSVETGCEYDTVKWTSALTANWGKTTVNGVNAYWVRLRCTAFSAATAPYEAMSDWFYMNHFEGCWRSNHCNWAKVAAADVPGDAPAILQLMVKPTVTASRVLRVARSAAGCLAGVVPNMAIRANTGDTAGSTAIGGFYSNHATPASTYTDGAASIALSAMNYGMYRMFARVYPATTASTAYLRAKIELTSTAASLFLGDDVVASAADKWNFVDLGLVSIQPPMGIDPSAYIARMQYKRTSACPAIYEDSLWLFPVSEFYHAVESAANTTSDYLLFNGIDNRAAVIDDTEMCLYESLEPSGQSVTLEPGRDNYLLFSMDETNNDNVLTDKLSISGYLFPRYAVIRGAS